MTITTSTNIRYQPIYTPADISLYGHVNPETLRAWTKGPGTPLIIPAGSGIASYSFVNLIEVHVLVGLRKAHKVPLRHIRKEVKLLRKRFATQNPLAESDFETDGYEIFFEHQGLKQTASGQTAIREVVDLYLQRIEREASGPVRFFPFTTWEKCPKLIVMNPSIDFGRPVIVGTRIETEIIRERFDAGESVRFLADDYGVQPEAVEEALRCEPERRAA